MTSSCNYERKQVRVQRILDILPPENVQAWETKHLEKLQDPQIRTIADAIKIVNTSEKNEGSGWAVVYLFLVLVALKLLWPQVFMTGWPGFFLLLGVAVLYLLIYVKWHRIKQSKMPTYSTIKWAETALNLFLEHASHLSPVIFRDESADMKRQACSPKGARSWVEALMMRQIAAERDFDLVRLAKGRDPHATKAAAEHLIEAVESLNQSWNAVESFKLFSDAREVLFEKVQRQCGYKPTMSS